MLRPLAFILLVFALFAPAVRAQSHGVDLIAGGQYPDFQSSLMRFTLGGQAATIVPKQADLYSSVCMETDNRQLVAVVNDLFGFTKRLVRIDPATGATVATIWAPSSRPSPFYLTAQPDQNGDYLLTEVLTGAVHRMSRDGTSITTLITPSAPTMYSGLIEDRTTGDYLLSTFGSPSIVRVDRDTRTLKATYPMPAMAIGFMMRQDPHLPTVYVAGGSLYAFDPASGALTTLSPPINNLPVGTVGVDRAPGPNGAMLQVGLVNGFNGGGPILSMDRSGTVLGTIAITPFNGAGPVVHERGRNLALERVRAPNDRRLRVSFPGQSGKAFVVAFSFSGYSPGMRLADGRMIPLNVDDLTRLSVTAPPKALVTGNVGFLDGGAEAIVDLDLNALGSAMNDVRLWAAAVTIDNAAPAGIGVVSAPILIVL